MKHETVKLIKSVVLNINRTCQASNEYSDFL